MKIDIYIVIVVSNERPKDAGYNRRDPWNRLNNLYVQIDSVSSAEEEEGKAKRISAI